MTPGKALQPLIPIDKIDQLVQIEPTLVLLGLAAIAWLVYKFFLKGVNQERHKTMRKLFKDLFINIIFGASFLSAYLLMSKIEDNAVVDRLLPYVGFIALVSGVIVFVKVCRVIAHDYLYLSHMTVQFPLLIVNLLMLLLSIAACGWIATVIFNIQLASVLTTSAIVSLVLGLALQDMLGNLFSGVALQVDKPYEIGDWIEIQSEGHKWTGQVREITWRSTLLVAFGDELITIPNRTMGQAQISNFHTKNNPIIRSQVFRIPFGAPIQRVKDILLQAIQNAPGVLKNPKPIVIITETTESWVSYKLVYYLGNYGAQFIVADEVISRCLETLEREGIEFAPSRLLVMK